MRRGGLRSAGATLAALLGACGGLDTSGTKAPEAVDASVPIDAAPAVDAESDGALPPARDAGDAPPPLDALAPEDGAADVCQPPAPAASPLRVRAASPAPTIDGDLSDWPCDAFVLLDASDAAYAKATSEPFSGAFAVAWDGTALYVGAHVVDANVVATNPDLLVVNDAVEIYLSDNLASTGDYDMLDHQYVIDASSSIADFGAANYPPSKPQKNPAGVTWSAKKVAGGYAVEAKIAPSVMALATFTAGEELAFDFQIDEGDGTTQNGALTWAITPPPATCTCQRCCCTNPDPPHCNVATFGRIVLQ